MAITEINSMVINSNNHELSTYKMMNDASADETTSDVLDVRNAEGITLLVESGVGVNAGVVTLEGAISSAYAGEWVSLGTVTTSAASTAYACSVSPSANPESNAAGLPMPYVRARISTVIGVGTVDVYIVVKK